MKKIADLDEWRAFIKKHNCDLNSNEDYDIAVRKTLRDVYYWLKAQPDAEEVKHGKWIKPTMYKGRGWGVPHCSNCGEMPDKVTTYCAECGSNNGLKVWKKSELSEEDEDNEICNSN